MKEQFVPYDLALKIKEKGFDDPCLAGYLLNKDGITSLIGCGALRFDTDGFVNPYSEILPAPLWQQVIDWLLKKHNIYVYIERDGGWWIVRIKDLSREEDEGAIDIELKGHFSNCFDELPKARQIVIEYALTLI